MQLLSPFLGSLASYVHETVMREHCGIAAWWGSKVGWMVCTVTE